MKSIPLRAWRQNDILISAAVFAFLVVFTYGILFLVPYSGFDFNPTDGSVIAIYEDLSPASGPHLTIGDVLQKVGHITFEQYSKDITVNFFDHYKPGDVVELVVNRNGEGITIPWVYPGFNEAEFPTHLFNVWWLAYVFWLIGTATQILMRPKDRRWGLFVAANYLTGMFIMLGAISWFGFLGSPILLRVSAWLMLPVYIHFHWIFPRSLRPIPRWLKVGFYIICGAIAVMQLVLLLPNSSYFFAVVLAFGGSIVLLAAHYIVQREFRRDLGILAITALLSFGFTAIASIVASSGYTPDTAVFSLLALPILPGAYFYVLYRHSLGGLEIRTNRAISLYIFLVIISTGLLLVVSSSSLRNVSNETFLFDTVVIALLTTMLGILIFPSFQRFLERRLLGIRLPADNMVENYSARIVASNTRSGLLNLLEAEVFPSLLVREYAFVRVADSSARIMLAHGVTGDQVREDRVMDLLASSPTGAPLPFAANVQPFEWVRLILLLRVGPDLIGAWLLGRRDPDDHYPQAELPVLQSLADQTAVALSNILQTERLKVMYEANIHRYEQERLRLARDLHDSVLNEMAAMLMKQDPGELPPGFQQSFDGLVARLREIVTDLRPSMLLYGLKPALDGLADNLSERNYEAVQIICEIEAVDDCRHPETVERNLYRIVQEACENALKYAHAKTIAIRGKISPDRIEIVVEDDGIGFKDAASLGLDQMVANKHSGLAGMHERADLVGASIRIDSKAGEGTRIEIIWNSGAFIY